MQFGPLLNLLKYLDAALISDAITLVQWNEARTTILVGLREQMSSAELSAFAAEFQFSQLPSVPKKQSTDTMVVVLPNQSLWPLLDSVRVKHDRRFSTYPPHVRLLSRFVPVEAVDGVCQQLAVALSETPGFRLSLSRPRWLTTFKGRAALTASAVPGDERSGSRIACMLVQEGEEEIRALTSRLRRLLGHGSVFLSDDDDGDSPVHLTLGQVKRMSMPPGTAVEDIISFPPGLLVDSITTGVSELFVLARDAVDGVFRVISTIPCGGDVPPGAATAATTTTPVTVDDVVARVNAFDKLTDFQRDRLNRVFAASATDRDDDDDDKNGSGEDDESRSSSSVAEEIHMLRRLLNEQTDDPFDRAVLQDVDHQPMADLDELVTASVGRSPSLLKLIIRFPFDYPLAGAPATVEVHVIGLESTIATGDVLMVENELRVVARDCAVRRQRSLLKIWSAANSLWTQLYAKSRAASQLSKLPATLQQVEHEEQFVLGLPADLSLICSGPLNFDREPPSSAWANNRRSLHSLCFQVYELLCDRKAPVRIVSFLTIAHYLDSEIEAEAGAFLAVWPTAIGHGDDFDQANDLFRVKRGEGLGRAVVVPLDSYLRQREHDPQQRLMCGLVWPGRLLKLTEVIVKRRAKEARMNEAERRKLGIAPPTKAEPGFSSHWTRHGQLILFEALRECTLPLMLLQQASNAIGQLIESQTEFNLALGALVCGREAPGHGSNGRNLGGQESAVDKQFGHSVQCIPIPGTNQDFLVQVTLPSETRKSLRPSPVHLNIVCDSSRFVGRDTVGKMIAVFKQLVVNLNPVRVTVQFFDPEQDEPIEVSMTSPVKAGFFDPSNAAWSAALNQMPERGSKRKRNRSSASLVQALTKLRDAAYSQDDEYLKQQEHDLVKELQREEQLKSERNFFFHRACKLDVAKIEKRLHALGLHMLDLDHLLSILNDKKKIKYLSIIDESEIDNFFFKKNQYLQDKEEFVAKFGGLESAANTVDAKDIKSRAQKRVHNRLLHANIIFSSNDPDVTDSDFFASLTPRNNIRLASFVVGLGSKSKISTSLSFAGIFSSETGDFPNDYLFSASSIRVIPTFVHRICARIYDLQAFQLLRVQASVPGFIVQSSQTPTEVAFAVPVEESDHWLSQGLLWWHGEPPSTLLIPGNKVSVNLLKPDVFYQIKHKKNLLSLIVRVVSEAKIASYRGASNISIQLIRKVGSIMSALQKEAAGRENQVVSQLLALPERERTKILRQLRELNTTIATLMNETLERSLIDESTAAVDNASKWIQSVQTMKFGGKALRRGGGASQQVRVDVQAELTAFAHRFQQHYKKLVSDSESRSMDSGYTAGQMLLKALNPVKGTIDQMLYLYGGLGYPISVHRSPQSVIDPWLLVVNKVGTSITDSVSRIMLLHAGIDGPVDCVFVREEGAQNLFLQSQLSKHYNAVVATRNPTIIIPSQGLAILCLSFVTCCTQLLTDDSDALFNTVIDLYSSLKQSVSSGWKSLITTVVKGHPSRYITLHADNNLPSISKLLACLCLFDEAGPLFTQNDGRLAEIAMAVLAESTARGLRHQISGEAACLRRKAEASNKTTLVVATVAEGEQFDNDDSSMKTGGTDYRASASSVLLKKALRIDESSVDLRFLDELVQRPDRTPPEQSELFDFDSAFRASSKFFKSQVTRSDINTPPQSVLACFLVADVIHNVANPLRARQQFIEACRANLFGARMKQFLTNIVYKGRPVDSIPNAQVIQISLYVQGLFVYKTKERTAGLPSLVLDPEKEIRRAAQAQRCMIFDAELRRQISLKRAGDSRSQRAAARSQRLLEQRDFLATHGGAPNVFTEAEVAAMNERRNQDELEFERMPSGLLKHRCCFPLCGQYLKPLATKEDLAFNRRTGLYRHLKLMFHPATEYLPGMNLVAAQLINRQPSEQEFETKMQQYNKLKGSLARVPALLPELFEKVQKLRNSKVVDLAKALEAHASKSMYCALAVPAGVAFATSVFACLSVQQPFFPMTKGHEISVPVSCLITFGCDDFAHYVEPTVIIVLRKDGSIERKVVKSTSSTAASTDPSPFMYAFPRSGTTGSPNVPTVIQVGRDGIIDHVNEVVQRLGIKTTDTVLWASPSTFDPGLIELLGVGPAAKKLVVASQFDPTFLAELIKREQVTVLHLTPSAFRLLRDASVNCSIGKGADNWLLGVRVISFGGEPLTNELLEPLRKLGIQVFNLYGLTELSIWQSCAVNDVSIGTPFSDIEMDVRPVAASNSSTNLGQVWLRSKIRWSSVVPQGIWFPTGDLVSIPELVFVRRLDALVKVHGQIINLRKTNEIVHSASAAAALIPSTSAIQIETIQSMTDGSLTSFVFMKQQEQCCYCSLVNNDYDHHRCLRLESAVASSAEEILVPRRIIVMDSSFVVTNHLKLNLSKLEKISLHYISLEREKLVAAAENYDASELKSMILSVTENSGEPWTSFTVARLASVVSFRVPAISFADVINVFHNSSSTTADDLIACLMARKRRHCSKNEIEIHRSIFFGACVDGPVLTLDNRHFFVGSHDHTVRRVHSSGYVGYDAGAPVDSELFSVSNNLVVLPRDSTMHFLSATSMQLAVATVVHLPSQGKGVCATGCRSIAVACLSGQLLFFSLPETAAGEPITLSKSLDVGSPLTGSPVLVHDQLLVPSADGCIYFINDNTMRRFKVSQKSLYAGVFNCRGHRFVVPTLDGAVYCFEGTEPKPVWKQTAFTKPLLSLPVERDNGNLFFVNQARQIFCLRSSDGAIVWSSLTSTSLNVKTRPTLTSNGKQLVVVGPDIFSVHCSGTGETLKTGQLPALSFSSPAYDQTDNSVWFGCRNDCLLNVQL